MNYLVSGKIFIILFTNILINQLSHSIKHSMKTILIPFIILIIFSVTTVYSQDLKTGKLKFKSGINYGFVSEQGSLHKGVSINTGLEFNSATERIRFNPNFTFGYHQEDDPANNQNDYLYPLIIETIMYFDLIKSSDKSFAWTLGLGAYGNITLGGGTMGSFGGYIGTGFNLTPKNSRYSIEILPVNYMLGHGPRKEIFSRLSLKYSL